MSAFSLEDVEALLSVAREAAAWGSTSESVEQRLTVVTDQLGSLVPFRSLTMLVVRPDSVPDILLCRGAPEADLSVYAERYMAHDPMVLAGFGSSRVVTLSDVVRPHEHGRDAMTGEFLPQRGVRHVLAASPRLPDGSLLALGMHRDARHGDFGRKERELLRLAAVDLARSAHLAVLRRRVDLLARSPASAAEGAVVFDAQGDVLHADDVGQALLRSAALRIDQVVEVVRRVAVAPAGPTVEAPLRLDGGGQLHVRLDRVDAAPGRSGGPQVVGQLRLERPSPAARLEAFAERHGLSTREAQIAGRAIDGRGNREIAYELGIAEPTVASHLSKVYRKAGVTSRTELARAVHGT